MRIIINYAENVNLGNYTSAKCGMKIQYDKDISSKAELREIKESLFALAKKNIREELAKIKEETNG